MKIYFDSCAIQRPLDSPEQVRVVLEIEALIGLFTEVDSGAIILISSEVLELEIDRIPTSVRRDYARNLLGQAKDFVVVTAEIEQRARQLTSLGIQPMDALHLACAEAVEVDYFCTCDERLLRKANSISTLHIKVVPPLQLIEELDL